MSIDDLQAASTTASFSTGGPIMAPVSFQSSASDTSHHRYSTKPPRVYESSSLKRLPPPTSHKLASQATSTAPQTTADGLNRHVYASRPGTSPLRIHNQLAPSERSTPNELTATSDDPEPRHLDDITNQASNYSPLRKTSSPAASHHMYQLTRSGTPRIPLDIGETSPRSSGMQGTLTSNTGLSSSSRPRTLAESLRITNSFTRSANRSTNYPPPALVDDTGYSPRTRGAAENMFPQQLASPSPRSLRFAHLRGIPGMQVSPVLGEDKLVENTASTTAFRGMVAGVSDHRGVRIPSSLSNLTTRRAAENENLLDGGGANRCSSMEYGSFSGVQKQLYLAKGGIEAEKVGEVGRARGANLEADRQPR
ncbi:hypothetical protein DL93DRAFT_305308 [Clavulina sp. PMI_390]|nr:hypothetical protein DL93DRAFT_305308 [Clavulina sp. PMI_390]